MGLFKKKEVIPQLPPAPQLPPIPKIPTRESLPELPSFPQSARMTSINREMVKSAVSDDEEQEYDDPESHEVPRYPMLPPRYTMSPSMKSDLPSNRMPERLPSVAREAPKAKVVSHGSESFYVRMDKFQESKESFGKVVKKLSEIEKTLEDLNKVKAQEEEEIKRWYAEIEELKQRLSHIDHDLFGQI